MPTVNSPSRRRLPPPVPKDVGAVLTSYPADARARLRLIRALVFEVADGIPGVGELEETLKWGEPAYLTPTSKSGSTLRFAWKAARPNHYSLFFNCNTTLVDAFRTLFPELPCVGNREIRLPLADPVPDTVRRCIEMTLTYHKPQLSA